MKFSTLYIDQAIRHPNNENTTKKKFNLMKRKIKFNYILFFNTTSRFITPPIISN